MAVAGVVVTGGRPRRRPRGAAGCVAAGPVAAGRCRRTDVDFGCVAAATFRTCPCFFTPAGITSYSHNW
jgi:hypothetical protein